MKRIALALLVAGCCGYGDVACVGSLEVHFDRPLALPYQYETPSPNQILRDVHECNQPACAQTLFLGASADTVVLRISRAGVALFEVTFAPQYHDVSPHNNGCGPFCRAATVELTVPSAVAARAPTDTGDRSARP